MKLKRLKEGLLHEFRTRDDGGLSGHWRI